MSNLNNLNNLNKLVNLTNLMGKHTLKKMFLIKTCLYCGKRFKISDKLQIIEHLNKHISSGKIGALK